MTVLSLFQQDKVWRESLLDRSKYTRTPNPRQKKPRFGQAVCGQSNASGRDFWRLNRARGFLCAQIQNRALSPRLTERRMMIAAFTGLIAGAVHVWSGPDHLAAIAPLAARRRQAAWSPGLRWGFGHSAGVALVGLLSLWLRDLLPLDLLSTWGERLVGVMLFGIGLWALRKALKVH